MIIKSKIATLLTITFLLFGIFIENYSFAATTEHIDIIFEKISEDGSFMESLYSAGRTYADRGVTDEYINNQLKSVIRRTINAAVEYQRTDKLTSSNFTEKIKEISQSIYLNLDSVFIAVIVQAFPENTLSEIMARKLPSSLMPLYNSVASETKFLLFEADIAYTPDYRFFDLDNFDWAREAILELAYAGVIDGMEECYFAPYDNITREQFVKLMAVICQLDTENAVSDFEDVPKDSWFYPYVSAMADAGYINGILEGVFGAGQNITRQDMAVILSRVGLAEEKLNKNNQTHIFQDNSDISQYAAEAVNLLYSYGIINGTPENYFYPENSATRAEATQMLYKFYKIYKDDFISE